jgi:hypothetical protein
VARCELGLGVRKTRERIRIGRALRELPAIEEAFVGGEISFSRAREVTRVATPDDEQHWLDAARSLPMRTLERRVVQAGGDSDVAREHEPAATRYLTPDVMELRMALPAEVWALARGSPRQRGLHERRRGVGRGGARRVGPTGRR